MVVGGSFAGDPLAEAFGRPRRVGLIALDPSRRRRARVNGTASAVDHGVAVHVEEAFANCTRRIRPRRPVESLADASDTASAVERASLSEDERRALAGADTVIVGTSSPHGADCSHRGGDAGFVEVLDADRLRWRERDGNAMLATVGNLLLDQRCALAVPAFDTGTVTIVSGTATLAWPGPDRPDLADGRSPEVTMTVRRCRTVPSAIGHWLDDEG